MSTWHRGHRSRRALAARCARGGRPGVGGRCRHRDRAGVRGDGAVDIASITFDPAEITVDAGSQATLVITFRATDGSAVTLTGDQSALVRATDPLALFVDGTTYSRQLTLRAGDAQDVVLAIDRASSSFEVSATLSNGSAGSTSGVPVTGTAKVSVNGSASARAGWAAQLVPAAIGGRRLGRADGAGSGGRRPDHRVPVRPGAGHADGTARRKRPRRSARRAHPRAGGPGEHPPRRHRRPRQDRDRHHRPDGPGRRRRHAGCPRTTLVALAGAVEHASEHPVARALAAAAFERDGRWADVTDFRNERGLGVRGLVDGHDVLVGRTGWVAEAVGRVVDRSASGSTTFVSSGRQRGATVVAVASDGRLVGALAVTDTLRTTSVRAVAEFRKLGIEPVLLTGDNLRTARTRRGGAGDHRSTCRGPARGQGRRRARAAGARTCRRDGRRRGQRCGSARPGRPGHRDGQRVRRHGGGQRPHADPVRPARGGRRDPTLAQHPADHQGQPVLGPRLQRVHDPARRHGPAQPVARRRRHGALVGVRRGQQPATTTLHVDLPQVGTTAEAPAATRAPVAV